MKIKLTALSFLISFQIHAQSWQIDESWKSSEVHIPEKWFSTKIENVSVKQPMPVVIYMHGCSGISQTDQSWANILKNLGLIVVIPNSLAIPGRQSNCDTLNKKTNLGKINAAKLRKQEIEYALDKIKDKPWVDQKNIFVMGHSEGAVGVTKIDNNLIKGIVISGFPCVHGIWANKNIPILAIGWRDDPWFGSRYNNKQCSDYWGDRIDAAQVILEGYGHGTANEPKAIESVTSFFKRLVDENKSSH